MLCDFNPTGGLYLFSMWDYIFFCLSSKWCGNMWDILSRDQITVRNIHLLDKGAHGLHTEDQDGDQMSVVNQKILWI